MANCDSCKSIVPSDITVICDNCKKLKFCSEKCKKYYYSIIHIFECPPPNEKNGLKSVHYLIRDLHYKVYPTNEKAIEDYGFANCRPDTLLDAVALFELYRSLVYQFGITADVLHDYCMQDKISDLIKEKFVELPFEQRGFYYSWFLQNQHLVKNGNGLSRGLSTNFSFVDGNNIINYGYNAELSYYYLNMKDPRLAGRSDVSSDVQKVINDIDSSGQGTLIQWHSCKSSNIFGHKVSVETLVEFCKIFKVSDSHINHMQNLNPF